MSSQFTVVRQAIIKRLHNRQFLQAGSLLMLANVIVLALGLIRTPAMTWLLPKEQVGMIGVVASWIPFVQLLSFSGLDSASYHFVAKGKPWALIVNVSHRLRWSLLSTAVLLGGAAYWWWQGGVVLAWMFVVAGLSYPLTIGLTAAGGMLGAQENFKGLFWYRLGESITNFAGFIPLLTSVWWISQVVTFYAANQVATAVMMIGVTWWLIRQLKRSGERPLPPDESAEVVRYGKHLTGIGSIAVAQSKADSLLVSLLFPLNIMADYSIAVIVSEQMKRLWSIYIMIRYPPLVRMPLVHRRRRFIIEGAIIAVGFLFMGAVLAVMAYWLIPVFLPESYSSSLGYMYWLIASFVVLVPGALAETYFRTLQNERQQYAMRVVGAVTSLITPLVLLKLSNLGPYSIAIGRFLANLVFSVWGVWLFKKEKIDAA
jgi:O-antigen/teichoic acid export membrane protein